MKKIEINTTVTSLLADVHTPVGIYLRLRDRFRDTVLLESTDNHAADNSWSFIGINAVAGIEVAGDGFVETKLPGSEAKRSGLQPGSSLAQTVWEFMQQFAPIGATAQTRFAQGFYGYFSFDTAAGVFNIPLPAVDATSSIPHIRFRLYQYVIAVHHHRDELLLLENKIAGLDSEADLLRSLINNKDVPVYPFEPIGERRSNKTDDEYVQMVKQGISSCHRGDVFQIVLSRRFTQPFLGDEFNVYRMLRHINPSPYLFYFDYGDYKLMGSSPEAQLVINKGKATMFPIAGTFKRTGNDEDDAVKAAELLNDAKENAEHVMLVDLARNDLSTVCTDVQVQQFRQVQYYSHVIHLVSEVAGKVPDGHNPIDLLFRTFPAGTLSGAPKHKALQLIGEYEESARSFYGGVVGFVGLDGTCNTAIMIRTVLSKNNQLIYQAGAGVVAASQPQMELQEVTNKLGAVTQAIQQASKIGGGVTA